MADLTAADVTYTILHRSIAGGPGALRRNLVRVQFGDGVKTYPAAGHIALDLPKMGFLTTAVRVVVVEGAAPFTWLGSGGPPARLEGHWPTGGTFIPTAADTDPILNPGAVAVTGSAATGPFRAGRTHGFFPSVTILPAIDLTLDVEGY